MGSPPAVGVGPAPDASRSPAAAQDSRRDETLRRRHDNLASIRAILEGESSSRRSTLVLMLCREGALSSEAETLIDRSRELGIPILIETDREMRRMSSGESAPELIALEGPSPEATLEELMLSDGLVFILAGLRYPGNVGFILRSAEVAGAAGVVLSTEWKGSEIAEALRVGMRADRFFPVLECAAEVAVLAARRAGRRLVALETVGDRALWDADLVVPTAVIIGGEARGVDASLLSSVDDVFRIPTRGFIPSYNVQAAVAMVLGEWLRQGATRLRPE